ncbi:MAG: hypothetical protein RL072_1828 [Actinomycetota bacterium]
MFLNVTDRRRITLVALLTLVTVPAVVFFTRGEPQAQVATVAAAGVNVSSDVTTTTETPAPVFLEGPAGIAPTGTAVIAYPSADNVGITGLATFSSFNGAPSTVCNAPIAPYGTTLVVKNLNNGRSIACSNVMMPSTPANVSIVLHTRLFVELSDLVNAPIPVSINW